MPDTVNDIDDQASVWATRVSEGTMSAADAAHLERWLSTDPRHRGAFVRARAGWLMVSRIAQTQRAVEGGLWPSSPSVTAFEPAAVAVTMPVRRKLASRKLGGLALAASVAAMALVCFSLGEGSKAYSSGLGEVRSVVLEDGSTATIGSSSAIAVAMRDDQRALKLERGEAWFAVAHNPRRPFVVSADDVQVRAVGTAFAVSRSEDGIDVLVSEGVVETRRDGGAPQRVSAGQTLHFAADRAQPAIREAPGLDEVDRRLGWRQRLISLDGDTLASAAERFNRYNRVQITIDDPALGAIKLTGRFNSSEALAFAEAAAKVAHARAVQQGDRIILSQ